MPFHWNQVTWSWLKPILTGGKESEGLVGGGTVGSGMPDSRGCPFLPCKEPVDRMFKSSPLKLTTEGTPLCMIIDAKQARCTTTILEEQTQKSETEKEPQCVNCPLPAQCQTDETPLGWVKRRLCAFIWMFLRASLLDKG